MSLKEKIGKGCRVLGLIGAVYSAGSLSYNLGIPINFPEYEIKHNISIEEQTKNDAQEQYEKYHAGGINSLYSFGGINAFLGLYFLGKFMKKKELKQLSLKNI